MKVKSIQSKILTAVIAGLLVITTLVTTIAVSMTHKILHKDADRLLNRTAQSEAAYINDLLGNVVLSSSIMADYAETELESVEQLKDRQFREAYLEKVKHMFLEIARNTEPVGGFYMRLNPEYTDNMTGFSVVLTENEDIVEMPLTDLSQYEQYDIQNVGWYYLPVLSRKPVWIPPYYSGFDYQLISYGTPLYVDGILLGVIGFDMNFDALKERVSRISVYDEGYAVLLAEDGETVYSYVDKHQGTDPHTKATVKLINGMQLELRADYKDIQKESRPMLKQIVVVFLWVMVGAMVYTIFMTRRIVRPLKQLIQMTEKLSTGIDPSEWDQFPLTSNDEIGTLARVLKSTYEQVTEYSNHINALAYRDSLTGINNGTAYAEAITAMNHEIICGQPQFGVLVVDINNLKQTNDKFGHDTGNALIAYTARILEEVFQTSRAYRIGGDEFAVILTGEDYEMAQELLTKLDEACRTRFIPTNEGSIPVSLARGLALFDGKVDKLYVDVFAKADKAMYRNKEEIKAALM